MLMARLGLQSYRLGLEWARLEPAEGVFDEDAIDRLKEELMLLQGLGIRPVITLHHFTTPAWFELSGGWSESQNIVYFLRYAERVVRRLGHLCDDYITFNAPDLYVYNGWRAGLWPPGHKSLSGAMRVLSVLAAAHIRTYRLIHRLRGEMRLPPPSVGAAFYMPSVLDRRADLLHSAAAPVTERLFHTGLAEAMLLGRFTPPMRNFARAQFGRYCDFVGLNYRAGGLSARRDEGRELLRCARRMYKLCDTPLFITCAVRGGDDAQSCRTLFRLLAAVSGSELPIRRYYHWPLLEGFAWPGSGPDCALAAVAPETLDRAVNGSGRLLAAIARERALTEEQYAAYIENA
jgi:beta-glucosidase